MAEALSLKVKKTLLKRKIEGEMKAGYYGRVITAGTKTVEDILKASTHGSTLDYREAKLALEMAIDAITEEIKKGFIVDLGPIGKLYPAVNGTWCEDPEMLSLSDMRGKVNYKPGDEIAAAVRGAKLSWTTEKETDENTVDDEENTPTGGGSTGGNQQGSGTQPQPGEEQEP